jgi:organic hydroperoxide reductase OsmC/OhrA
MTTHTATVEWARGDSLFTDRRYSRAHTWRFDGGLTVPASSSPHVVRTPLSNPANVDPEEAYVAALSSCHMLWFLDLTAQAGFVVDRYVDAATGVMAKNAEGREWVSVVEFAPEVTFSGRAPSAEQLAELHHRAHDSCYLANSVKTDVRLR